MKMNCEALPDALNAGGVRFQGVDWGELNISHIHLPKGAGFLTAFPFRDGETRRVIEKTIESL